MTCSILERRQLTQKTGDLDGEARTLQSRLLAKEDELTQSNFQMEKLRQMNTGLERSVQQLTMKLDELQGSSLKEKTILQERLVAAEQEVGIDFMTWGEVQV